MADQPWWVAVVMDYWRDLINEDGRVAARVYGALPSGALAGDCKFIEWSDADMNGLRRWPPPGAILVWGPGAPWGPG